MNIILNLNNNKNINFCLLSKHLDKLNQIYLKPIKNQGILSVLDTFSLFGRMDEILQFQKQFLNLLRFVIKQNLPSGNDLTNRNYQEVLVQISKLFLYYVSHFRLYSVFCSAHSKAQKLLFAKDSPNSELVDFVKKTSNGNLKCLF